MLSTSLDSNRSICYCGVLDLINLQIICRNKSPQWLTFDAQAVTTLTSSSHEEPFHTLANYIGKSEEHYGRHPNPRRDFLPSRYGSVQVDDAMRRLEVLSRRWLVPTHYASEINYTDALDRGDLWLHKPHSGHEVVARGIQMVTRADEAWVSRFITKIYELTKNKASKT